jgi:hypothetical protein
MTVFERRVFGGVLGSWMILSLLSTILRVSLRLSSGSPVYLSNMLYFFVPWFIEGVAGGLLAIFAWRRRNHPHRFVRFAGAAMGAFIVAKLVHFACWLALRPFIYGASPLSAAPKVLNSILSVDLSNFFILAVGSISAVVMIGVHRDGLEVEKEAARLEAALAEARLRNVRNQVKPQLVHQSLARIEQSLPDEPQRAEAELLNLSDFLRIALLRASGSKLPPSMESDYVRLEREVTEAVAG